VVALQDRFGSDLQGAWSRFLYRIELTRPTKGLYGVLG